MRHPGAGFLRQVITVHARRPESDDQPLAALGNRPYGITGSGGGKFIQRGNFPRQAVVPVNECVGTGHINRRPAVEQAPDAVPGEQIGFFPHFDVSGTGNAVPNPHQFMPHRMQQQGILPGIADIADFRRIELRDIEGDEAVLCPVVVCDSPARGGAENGAVRSSSDGKDPLGRRAVVLVARVEALDPVVFHVDPVDSVIGRHPDNALRLLDDIADYVVRNRIRIVRRELVGFEIIPVVYVQAVPRTNPEQPGRILVDAVDRTVRQSVRIGKRVVFHRRIGERHGCDEYRQQ